jgi:hypothetical protein
VLVRLPSQDTVWEDRAGEIVLVPAFLVQSSPT